MKRQLVSDEEAQEIRFEVEKWFSESNGMFSDCKSSACAAVGEYLANKEGKTFYKLEDVTDQALLEFAKRYPQEIKALASAMKPRMKRKNSQNG